MNTTIYYFTGTGNSLKIAKDLKNELKESKLVQICEDNSEIRRDKESDKIGFVFPVYYRGLPHMVKKFVENLQISEKTYFFAVASFGSYEALAFEQLNNILISKGVKLSSVFGIPMPGSMWFMYYPHPKQDYIDRINSQKEITLKIAKEINDKTVIRFNDVPNRISEQKMYDEFKPNNIDENYWTDEKCNGCGICSKVCPANNIEIVDKKPMWKHKCEQCLACLHWCPNESIQYKQDSLNKERYHNPHIKVDELFRNLNE